MDNATEGKRAQAPSILLRLTRLGLLVGAICALYLLNNLVTEFRHISAKLDNIDGMARDIGHLSNRLAALEDTNAGIRRIEEYMRYVPVMAKTSAQGLDESRNINRKLEVTNNRLMGTNSCMINTAGGLMDVTNGLSGLRGDMRHMRRSVGQLAAGLPALDGMRNVLERTGSNLEKTATGVQDVTSGINRMGKGLDETRDLLKAMSVQFAVLPEMKQSFDATSNQVAAALSTVGPLSREIPKFSASLQEMNETTRQMNVTSQEMNRTTQEMAAGLKKTHRQGVLGLAALTAAGFVR
ncbi:MAG: hypothetical protein ACYC64_11585 [Armatimonadota bacterium]